MTTRSAPMPANEASAKAIRLLRGSGPPTRADNNG
jgi:hypothetical protein